MGNILAKQIKLTAKKFNLERKLRYPKDSYLLILKRNGSTTQFDILETFAGKKADFSSYWSDFRNAQTFEIARDGAEITNADGQTLAHHISIGTHVSLSGDVFAYLSADEIKPFFDDATWKIFAKATGQRFEKP